jgi:ribosomal protein S12 methylthiotransferase
MDVLEIMKREPICNYIDIPLQHISDSILKSMRRGTTQENNQIIKDFRSSSEMAIRTTLIVDMGETQEKHLKDWVQK